MLCVNIQSLNANIGKLQELSVNFKLNPDIIHPFPLQSFNSLTSNLLLKNSATIIIK